MKSIKLLIVLLCIGSMHGLNIKAGVPSDGKTQYCEDSIISQPEDNYKIWTLTSGHRNRSSGFYIGFTNGYGKLDNKGTYYSGMRVTYVANHSFAIGVAGKGFISEIFQTTLPNISQSYTGGYGGIFVEPMFFSENLVNISMPLLLGAGATSKLIFDNEWNYSGSDEYAAYIIFEPGIEIDVNVTKWFRIGAYGSIKLTNDILSPEYHNDVFSSDMMKGYSLGMSLKFGIF